MPTASPLQRVKERFGSKSALVDHVVGLVEPLPGESSDDHKRRLRNAPNSKLLHLVAVGDKVKELGGREALVRKVLELKGQTKDHEYADKLKTLSLGRLLDMSQSLQWRANGKAKKKPKSLRKKG